MPVLKDPFNSTVFFMSQKMGTRQLLDILRATWEKEMMRKRTGHPTSLHPRQIMCAGLTFTLQASAAMGNFSPTNMNPAYLIDLYFFNIVSNIFF